MFEQSSPSSYSYDYAPAPEPLKEGDPFYDYEMKGWKLSPRIYKILGISAVVNLILFAIMVQGSLLTMKGCDSPVVGRMCEVLDTVYVGSMLFGTERQWKDVEYDKTDLGDVDITYVDVSSEKPPLEYPAGYFAISNPEKYTIDPETGQVIAAMTSQGVSDLPPGFIAPGIPFSPTPGATGDLFNTKPNYPKHNPSILEGGPLPEPGSSGTSPGPSFSRKRRGGGKVTTAPGTNPDGSITGIPGSGQVGQVKPSPSPSVEPTAPVTDVELNKRPFVDLATIVNDLQDKKQVDLNTPFLITATGKLNKDGKLDPKTFAFGKQVSSDPKMIEVVKEAIEAMNASGYLQYLSMVDVKNLSFTIMQDDANVSALVESQFDNDLRPKTVADYLNAYINKKKEAKMTAEASENDKDDLLLLSNAAAVPQGKKVVIQFTIPKANIQQMIQRKLAEQKAAPKQPNSGGVTTSPSNNTAKN